MDYPLIAILPLVTFAIIIGVALWSRKRTRDKIDKETDEKSSLAKDGPGPQPRR